MRRTAVFTLALTAVTFALWRRSGVEEARAARTSGKWRVIPLVVGQETRVEAKESESPRGEARTGLRIVDEDGVVVEGATALPCEIHGRDTLLVRAPGYATRYCGTATSQTVVLEAGFLVGGRVIDSAGTPLEGVRLRLCQSSGGCCARSEYSPETTSDAWGAFSFDGISCSSCQLRLWHTGYCTAGTSTQAGDGRVEIVLFRSGSVSGRVVFSDGRPATEAQIGVDHEVQDPCEEGSQSKFLVSGLAPGSHEFRAWLSNTHEAWSEIVLEEGERKEGIVLELHDCVPDVEEEEEPEPEIPEETVADPPPFGAARGRVAGSSSKDLSFCFHPIALDEKLSYPIDSCGRLAREADGGFRVGELPPGRWTVTVGRGRLPEAHARFDVRVDQETDIGTLTLTAPETVSGRITDERGEPLGGAQISFVVEHCEYGVFTTNTHTDGAWRLKVPAVVPGFFLVRKRGYGTVPAAVDALDEIQLSKPGRLIVRVDGDPDLPALVRWPGSRARMVLWGSKTALSPGWIVVEVAGESRDVEIVSGRTTEVVFRPGR